ncbi:hypothetical protein ACWV27_06110 [Massilia varians]
MNARLRDYRILWRAAVSHATPFSSAIIRWGGGFLLIVCVAVVWMIEGLRGLAAMAWWGTCGAVLAAWTWRFMPGAVKLNSPSNAKLVPGMRRRLVELACVAWIVPLVGIALLPNPDGGSLGLWLLLVVCITLGSALATAGHRAGTAFIYAACFDPLLAGQLPQAVGDMLSRPPALALALLLYAGLAVVAVREMLPEGGECHWRMEAKRARVFDPAGKRDVVIDKVAGKHTRGWYSASLRRACERRDSRRLVLHALGPAHHLGELVAALGLLACTLVVIAILSFWRTKKDVLAGIGWLLPCTLLAVPFATSLRLNSLAGSYPGEGALARLAPAMPGLAPSFNRHLGRALLLESSKGWALGAAAVLLLTALTGADLPTLVRQAGICCLTLPLVAAPLRNHARRAPGSAIMPAALLLLSIAVSISVGLAVRAATGLPLMLTAALVSIVVAAYAAGRGLHVMERAPFAFPAGRMD